MLRAWNLELIIGMAVVTYLARVGMVGFAKQFELHPLLKRALEYVPVAILAALVFPSILAPTGAVQSPATNIYLWAALVSAALQLLLKKQWLSIVAGVAVLVVLRQLGA